MKGPKRLRPFGPAFHGTSANDLLPFDNIEVAPSNYNTRDKHVLMWRDDHADYKWVFLSAMTRLPIRLREPLSTGLPTLLLRSH